MPTTSPRRPLNSRRGLRAATTYRRPDVCLLFSVQDHDVDEKTYYHSPAESIPLVKNKTIPWMVLEACRSATSKATIDYIAMDVLSHGEGPVRSITLRELSRNIFYVAQNLATTYNFKKGDIMLFALANSVDYMVMFYAVGLCGGVCALSEHPIKEGTLMQELKEVGARFIFTADTHCSMIHRVAQQTNQNRTEGAPPRIGLDVPKPPVERIFVVGNVHPLSEDVDMMTLKTKVATSKQTRFEVIEPLEDLFCVTFVRNPGSGSLNTIQISHHCATAAYKQAAATKRDPMVLLMNLSVFALPFSWPSVLAVEFPLQLKDQQYFAFLNTWLLAEKGCDKSHLNALLRDKKVTNLILAASEVERVVPRLLATGCLDEIKSIEIIVDSVSASTEYQRHLATLGPRSTLRVVHSLMQRGGFILSSTVLTADPSLLEVGHLLPNTSARVVLKASQQAYTAVNPDGTYTYDQPRPTDYRASKIISTSNFSPYPPGELARRRRSVTLSAIPPPVATKMSSGIMLTSTLRKNLATRSLLPMQIGEIWMNGPQVCRVCTAELPFLADIEALGYYPTGFIGYVDQRGSIVLAKGGRGVRIAEGGHTLSALM